MTAPSRYKSIHYAPRIKSFSSRRVKLSKVVASSTRAPVVDAYKAARCEAAYSPGRLAVPLAQRVVLGAFAKVCCINLESVQEACQVGT